MKEEYSMEIPAGAKSQKIQDKVYVYIDRPFWNPDKRRGEHKRDCIGKIVDGQFSPNKKYLLQLQEEAKVVKPGPVPTADCKRQFYGATYLLDRIGEKLGITDDLKACFPNLYKQIMSISYFLVLENGLSMYRFRKWSLIHRHPYGEVLSSSASATFWALSRNLQKWNFFDARQSVGQRRNSLPLTRLLFPHTLRPSGWPNTGKTKRETI